jgi:hypothetical protein
MKLQFSQLTEGIVNKHVGAERARLVEKWSKTGLLKGLDAHHRGNMAQLLENQCKQVLQEANAISNGAASLTSSGQISGFSSIAFPIVRRVFGGLVANELVSVQPMSLPSGLIFYRDYTYGSNVGGDAGVGLSNSSTNETYTRGQSIYSNPPGRGIQSGSLAAGGMYDLMGAGYSKVHSGSTGVSGTVSFGAFNAANDAWLSGSTVQTITSFTGSNARFAGFDPQLEVDLQNNVLDFAFMHLALSELTASPNAIPRGDVNQVDQIALFAFGGNGGTSVWGEAYQHGTGVRNLRRLNKRGNWDGTTFTPDALNGTHVQMVIKMTNASSATPTGFNALQLSMALTDALVVESSTGAALTIPSFETDFGTPSPAIPEIDIKIESIAITATSRKLRARWSPELAQDLNAYHAIDAEAELTSVLSEEVALEIDREILSDLVTVANGANMFWSRAPGKFVNKLTGTPISLANSLSIGPQFTGNIQEWYNGLIETIVDVANSIHRKTLRGSANFIVVSPDVSTILENTVAYKSNYKLDGAGQVSSPFVVGAEAIGTVSSRFTVYRDPYFPRNKVLVGYKGGSYLETGYVYAPYVPLIVTPTIYAPEDFSPRRGVMTRYAKKCIRSDFYGTVVVTDMNII